MQNQWAGQASYPATPPVTVNESTIAMQVEEIGKLAGILESTTADIKYRITGESEPKCDSTLNAPTPAALAAKISLIGELLYRIENHVNRIAQKIGG